MTARSPQQAVREVSAIRSMPYGLARTQAAERALGWLEQDGPAEVLAYGLFTLVESYYWGGEGAKAYVPFQRAMRLWDANPELFDETDKENFFWSFKWMVCGLFEYPWIPAQQIDATLQDMERRFRLNGNGMDAFAFCAFTWANHRGDPRTEELLGEWIRTPADEYSQCEACSISDEVEYLASEGRLDEVVSRLANVPPTTARCATEPANMEALLALVELERGDLAAGLRAHRRAVAALATSESDMAAARGRRIEFLARGGAFDRAIAALEADGGLATGADSPLGRLSFLVHLRAALQVMALAEADRPISIAAIPVANLGELREWVDGEAAQLSRAFDERNGTDRHWRRLERARLAEPASSPLDFTVLPRDAGSDVATASDRLGEALTTGSGQQSGAVDPSTADAPDWAQVESRARDAEKVGDLDAAARDFLAAARLAAAAGLLEDSGYAQANAARIAHLLGDDDGAHEAYRSALARLTAGGCDPERFLPIVVAWAGLATTSARGEDVLQVCSAVLGHLAGLDLSTIDAALQQRRKREVNLARAEVDDTTARIIATVPGVADWSLTDAVSLAISAAETYAEFGAPRDAAHAFWLAGRLQRDQGMIEQAVWSLESAFEGFGIARDPRNRAEAASELIALLRESGQESRAEEIVASLAG